MQIEQYTFDVIERLRNQTQAEVVVSELTRVMGDFGFDTFMATGIPRPGQSMSGLVLSAHWPDDWMRRYMARGYDQTDPTVARVRETLLPFRWTDVRRRKLSSQQELVMNEACEFNLNEGLVIPIHDFNGLEAGISFGTSKYMADDRAESALHLIALYAYEAMRKCPITGNGDECRRLSKRERECVQWTAAGKTAWEIGQILRLSEATVKEYLSAASAKLNTRTRPQLVAKCLRAGIIS